MPLKSKYFLKKLSAASTKFIFFSSRSLADQSSSIQRIVYSSCITIILPLLWAISFSWSSVKAPNPGMSSTFRAMSQFLDDCCSPDNPYKLLISRVSSISKTLQDIVVYETLDTAAGWILDGVAAHPTKVASMIIVKAFSMLAFSRFNVRHNICLIHSRTLY